MGLLGFVYNRSAEFAGMLLLQAQHVDTAGHKGATLTAGQLEKVRSALTSNYYDHALHILDSIPYKEDIASGSILYMEVCS